ncbi:MAG TPA: hypothetical protein VFK32_08955 [Tepidiformaceae bacterium]|nr:hypothetical protein [Tepidiformaceae bacterium]
MVEFTVLKKGQAPRPARQTGRLGARMREYEAYVTSLKGDEEGKLLPSTGETPRGVALRISRAAKRIGKSVDTWVVDGVVYFRIG